MEKVLNFGQIVVVRNASSLAVVSECAHVSAPCSPLMCA